jgi:hypothetical protein
MPFSYPTIVATRAVHNCKVVTANLTRPSTALAPPYGFDANAAAIASLGIITTFVLAPGRINSAELI